MVLIQIEAWNPFVDYVLTNWVSVLLFFITLSWSCYCLKLHLIWYISFLANAHLMSWVVHGLASVWSVTYLTQPAIFLILLLFEALFDLRSYISFVSNMHLLSRLLQDLDLVSMWSVTYLTHPVISVLSLYAYFSCFYANGILQIFICVFFTSSVHSLWICQYGSFILLTTL